MSTAGQADRAAFIIGAVRTGYTYSQVGQALGISRQRAHQMARAADGIWKASIDSDRISSEMSQLLQVENEHPPLPTEPMGVRQVAEIYGLHRTTIQGWLRRGYIRVIERGGGRGNLTLLNAEDLQRVLSLYFDNPGQGRDPLKPLKTADASS